MKFMQQSTQEEILVGSAWYLCSSCKSCSSSEPISFSLALWNRVTELTSSTRSGTLKDNGKCLKTKCKLGR